MSDREMFFRYLRQRAANIRAIGEMPAVPMEGYRASMAPEQLLVATAALEALSGHWARIWRVKRATTVVRLSTFLDAHAGQDVWGRVALPPLLRYAVKERAELMPVLSAVPGQYTPMSGQREFRQDPMWTDLRDKLIAEIGADTDVEDLQRFRYAHILYRHYRNAWVHELNGAGGAESIWSDHTGDKPWYQNKHESDEPLDRAPTSTRRVLVLPPLLLVKTLDDVIESMERACIADNIDPTKGLRRRDPWGLAA